MKHKKVDFLEKVSGRGMHWIQYAPPHASILAIVSSSMVRAKAAAMSGAFSRYCPGEIYETSKTKEISMNIGVKVLITKGIIRNSKQTKNKSNDKLGGRGKDCKSCGE